MIENIQQTSIVILILCYTIVRFFEVDEIPFTISVATVIGLFGSSAVLVISTIIRIWS